MHFFTGFHGYYHRPSDDHEKLNLRGMRRITELARDTIVDLAHLPIRPLRQNTETLDALFGMGTRASRPTSPRPVSLGVQGTIDGRSGYLVRRTIPRSLAARSGLRPGDRITRIGSRKIVTEGDYAEATKAIKQGKAVTLLILRGSVTLEVDVLVN
jgi:S1-C subfamily serine protease